MRIPPELLNNFLIESGTIDEEHFEGTLYEHLIGTWNILKELQCSDDVCNAGLFHSIYGTDIFKSITVSKDCRNEVKNLIGERAEKLVNYFSTAKDPREKNFLNFPEPDRSDLMVISFANALEQLGWCETLYNMFEPYVHYLPIHLIEKL